MLEGKGATGEVPTSGHEFSKKNLYIKHLRFIQEQQCPSFVPHC